MARILVDVCHPAHAHFFRAPLHLWTEQGHEVSVTSRNKDVAIEILDGLGIAHRSLGKAAGSPWGLAAELIRRNALLTAHIHSTKADIAVALGGTFAAQSAFVSRIPSVVFYDTEMASMQNRITYPLATRVVVPNCYSGWTPKGKTVRYPGYHELSYLDPRWFKPDRATALQAGLDEHRPTYLVRLVSWTANHDIGDRGLSPALMEAAIERLSAHGKVIVSSEAELPPHLKPFLYRGPALHMHHLMAFCTGYFGESATMASECAVLGVPAIYMANSRRGYTDEQESKYGLVKNIHSLDTESLQDGLTWLLGMRAEACREARDRMLRDCENVAVFVAQQVLSTLSR
ncbi:DUF354 domain-containing protein [Pseudoxanthomonas sp. PXM03]|uniref:DUF354 domain-containing protein n=1 Tax=Pseudoxanthomonas sp. PXM03 TaxID=2769284 RepID=UPI00177B614A|nr:DUF354 domain-containing protein [Pseudoxanthomonas sp. PXM03]MBD9436881.1 DUF354 domain-containing protein [Pseudoxanthomonas sp. PXM03]